MKSPVTFRFPLTLAVHVRGLTILFGRIYHGTQEWSYRRSVGGGVTLTARRFGRYGVLTVRH